MSVSSAGSGSEVEVGQKSHQLGRNSGNEAYKSKETLKTVKTSKINEVKLELTSVSHVGCVFDQKKKGW